MNAICTAENIRLNIHQLDMQETEPLDIILVKRNGVRTGEAFVLLRLPVQVEHVLQKNKTNLGHRYIEVALAKKLVLLPPALSAFDAPMQQASHCKAMLWQHSLQDSTVQCASNQQFCSVWPRLWLHC